MRRFIVLTLVCAVSSTTLLALGWTFALTLGSSLSHWFGLEMLYFASPQDMQIAQLEFAFACAIAPLITWLAVLAHRVRGQDDPPPLRVALYFAAPALAVVVGMVLRSFWMRSALAADVPTNFAAMVPLRNVLPSYAGLEAGALLGGLMILGVIVFTKRPDGATPAPSNDA